MTPDAGHEGQEDADLLAELAKTIAHVDPVPPGLLAAAEASLILHTIDADLAALTYDSAGSGDMASVRGAPSIRTLTFEAPEVTVELEAEVVGPRRRLVGQLVPAQDGEIEVRHRGGVASVAVDALGRFVTTDIDPGPVSLRCRVRRGADPVVVDTEWFLA